MTCSSTPKNTACIVRIYIMVMTMYIETVSILGIVYSTDQYYPNLKNECRITWIWIFALNIIFVIVSVLQMICILDKNLNSQIFVCHIFCISATIFGFINHFILILGCQGVLYFEAPKLFSIIMLLFLNTVINFGVCNLTSSGAKSYVGIEVTPCIEQGQLKSVKIEV
jgi:hypothetical protein